MINAQILHCNQKIGLENTTLAKLNVTSGAKPHPHSVFYPDTEEGHLIGRPDADNEVFVHFQSCVCVCVFFFVTYIFSFV